MSNTHRLNSNNLSFFRNAVLNSFPRTIVPPLVVTKRNGKHFCLQQIIYLIKQIQVKVWRGGITGIANFAYYLANNYSLAKADFYRTTSHMSHKSDHTRFRLYHYIITHVGTNINFGTIGLGAEKKCCLKPNNKCIGKVYVFIVNPTIACLYNYSINWS